MIKKTFALFLIFFCLCFSGVALCANNIQHFVFGVQGNVLKNIEARLKCNQNILADELKDTDLETYNQGNINDIKNALAPFGYFKPTINSQIVKQHSKRIFIYHIDEGPQLKIRSLDLKLLGPGQYDPCFVALLENFPLANGDVLVSEKYQRGKTNLTNLALQRGYFSAQFIRSEVRIDLKHYCADIILHFDTGYRYRFGKVIFYSSTYCENFLHRFVPFCENEFFSNEKMIKFQENLSTVGFFQSVAITPKPEEAKNFIVPIEVHLIPRKFIQYSFGLGYGTDTGLRGLAGLQFRRLNCMGHHLETTLQASERQNHWEGSYSIPGCNPVTDLYKITAAVETQNLPTSGDTRYLKLEPSYIKALPYDWIQTLSLSLRNEYSEPTDGPTLNSTMILPSINWSKIRSDDLLHPRNGYSLNINLKGTSRALISNTNFLQINVQAKNLWSITNSTRLILRGNAGYTLISDVDELPISLQFYAGGSQSVRGYQFQSIGPGKSLLVGSIEFQQRIFGNFYAAIFSDAGSVNNGLRHLKKSLGIGAVWLSPVGAIEITLAQALDTPGQPRLLQFSMGPEL